jgi:hypothetical protein
MQVRSCFGQHTTIRLWQKHQLFFIDGIRFIHANQNHFFDLLNRCKFWNVFNGNRLSHICGSSSFTSTESSETVSYKVLQRSINMNRTFWEIAVLIASLIFNHFQLKHPHANSHCTNYDFQIHFPDGWFVRHNINFTLWAICWNHNHRNLTVKCFCKSRIII